MDKKWRKIHKMLIINELKVQLGMTDHSLAQ